MMLAIPTEPILWMLFVVSGASTVAFVLDAVDLPAMLREQVRRWRE